MQISNNPISALNVRMRIAEIFASKRKSGSKNTTVMSGFKSEVEIRPFGACAIQPLFMTESPKFSRLEGNWGRETRWCNYAISELLHFIT